MNAAYFLERLTAQAWPLYLDAPAYSEILEAQGWKVQPLGHPEQLQACRDEGVVVVATSLETTEQLRRLWGVLPMPLVHLSVAKFDASLAGLCISLEQLRMQPVAETLAQRTQHYQALFSSSRCEVESSAGRLTCVLHDEVEVANAGETLEPGHLYSITELGEAALLNLSRPEASFTLSGVLAFQGMSCLSNTPAQQEQFGPTLERLRLRACEGPNRAYFEQNQLVRLEIGGQNCIETLQTLFQEVLDFPEWGLSACELGLGASQGLQSLDGRFNSPLQRTRPGFFVGIGRGARMPHLDLIAVEVQAHFYPAGEQG